MSRTLDYCIFPQVKVIFLYLLILISSAYADFWPDPNGPQNPCWVEEWPGERVESTVRIYKGGDTSWSTVNGFRCIKTARSDESCIGSPISREDRERCRDYKLDQAIKRLEKAVERAANP